MQAFNYDEAFSRNIGWLTPDEQTRLRDKKIAIAGLGGAGGVHLLTLARLGIVIFAISGFFHQPAGVICHQRRQILISIIS